jgi:predicted metallo-beta-lactamase superfamily hydrolase
MLNLNELGEQILRAAEDGDDILDEDHYLYEHVQPLYSNMYHGSITDKAARSVLLKKDAKRLMRADALIKEYWNLLMEMGIEA